MEIKRDIHLQKLIESKHNGMIKIVTGIRRCGKSYLLFNLFCQHLKTEGVDDGQRPLHIGVMIRNHLIRDMADLIIAVFKSELLDCFFKSGKHSKFCIQSSDSSGVLELAR